MRGHRLHAGVAPDELHDEPLSYRRDLRRIAIGISVVAATVVILALQVARALFIPVLLGVLASYVLEPPVAALTRWRVPRALAATLVAAAFAVLAAVTVYALWNQASVAAAKLPAGAQELRETVQRRTSTTNPVSQVQKAAAELKRLTDVGTDAKTAGRQPVNKVQIQPSSFNLVDYMWSSSAAALGLVADTVVVCFLALYLLIAGDLFRRLLIEIAGPALSQKKVTLQLLDEISAQISRYLFLRATISALVAVGTAVALWAVGMAQPGVWGIVAGAANVIPYAGPTVVAAAVAIAAFVQFQSIGLAALAVLATLLVASIEAYVVTPWLTSRAAEMNTVAVFLGLVFWGWVWGLPGLFVAVPLMMILKAVCEHVEVLHPIAVLLGTGAPAKA